MPEGVYRFQVGDIACTALLDGVSHIDNSRFMGRFPEGTETEYRAAFEQMGLSLDDATSSINVLLIETEGERILVDTGEGGDLPNKLAAAGVLLEDITTVIITHTHGDHIQGLLAPDGGPAFPNARYVISKREYEWRQGQGKLHPALSLMAEHDLRQIDSIEMIVPGVTSLPIPGHTPGQIALKIESQRETMLHLADLLHSPMQFVNPEWSAKFDADTTISVPTRRKALRALADDDDLAMFYHLGFPGVGRVRRHGDSFRWEPVG